MEIWLGHTSGSRIGLLVKNYQISLYFWKYFWFVKIIESTWKCYKDAYSYQKIWVLNLLPGICEFCNANCWYNKTCNCMHVAKMFYKQPPKRLELGSWHFERMFPPPPACHMSRVTCHMSSITCHVSLNLNLFFQEQMVELVGGGSVVNRVYPVWFINTHSEWITISGISDKSN